MKKQFLKASVALALLAATQMAGAETLNPFGSSGLFGWTTASGAIDSISIGAGPMNPDTGWSYFDPNNQQVSISSVQDCCIAGDSFALLLDGVQQAWDVSGFTGLGGLFEAHLADLQLSGGMSHFITFQVLTFAGGEQPALPGAGFYQFGSIQPSAVPLPAAALLFGSTLLGAAGFGRKQRAAKKQEMEALAA